MFSRFALLKFGCVLYTSGSYIPSNTVIAQTFSLTTVSRSIRSYLTEIQMKLFDTLPTRNHSLCVCLCVLGGMGVLPVTAI